MGDSPAAQSAASAAACAVSGHLDTRTAATEVAGALHDGIGAACDLAIVFASFHHRAALADAVDAVRQTIRPRTTLAITAESVLGGDRELDGVAGMSAIALRMPGVAITPWLSTPDDPLRLGSSAAIADRIGLVPHTRAVLLLADPFTTPITRLLPALTRCGGERQEVLVIGGMLSGASKAGHNVLILDDRALSGGAIGVSIAGNVDVGCVVSQGCRPIGRTLTVTRAHGNVIEELDGRPALQVLHDVGMALGEAERQLMTKGLLLGTVIDSEKKHVGRGDFLVRGVLGFDRGKESIAVGDVPSPGQTVQFHVRDAVAAAEDLQLLLDAEVMDDRPLAALLFTCNGRGRRLFGEVGHDTRVIAERLGRVPLAGFFAAGEIGPVGGRSFLHGHTAALAMLRSR
jgi:small ligand-binding sensory domain FIST